MSQSKTPKKEEVDGDRASEEPKEIKIPDELLKQVPEAQRPALRAMLQVLEIKLTQESFKGPLPSPETLRGYEETLPGAADRILTMAEKEQDQRLTNQTKTVDTAIQMQKLGLLSSSVITVIILLGSFVLLANGKDAAGVAGIVLAASTLVGRFIYSLQTSTRSKPALPAEKPKGKK